MIYTCTMNPAIDLFVSTNEYLPEIVNRTVEDDVQANGKGVNVSFVLKMLDIESKALGFSGGFTGRFIEEELQEKGIQTDFVKVDGLTRINVFTHVESENTEYKLVNQGPLIQEKQIQQLLTQISELTKEDLLIVSGSNPKGITDEVLKKIAEIAKKNKFRFVLDTSSAVVMDCLEAKPYCLKPNDEELAVWFQKTALSDSELLEAGKQLILSGAEMVLVSLGSKGSLFFSKEKILYGNAPTGKVVNTACAGDTLLATFIGCLEKGAATEAALKMAIAAGSSTAFSPGLTDFKDVKELQKQITIKDLTTK
ncbi:1-phosphofructokinase [Carnobacterium gallinarum]|uniref:1-phosphofructokinase n=1 Tax=Carnobacterium gallinarum TaxID=2749 RepID=UPI00054F1584|nr:1-phosphofructokinase [Carnobacterium gallinarum]